MKATELSWIIWHAKTDIFNGVNGILEDLGYFKSS